MAQFRDGLVRELFQLTKQQRYDVNLFCKYGFFSVHKVILAAASPVLKNFFLRHGNLPYINLIDVERNDLAALLTFIYDGVEEDQLHQESCVKLSKQLGIAIPACQPQVKQHDAQTNIFTNISVEDILLDRGYFDQTPVKTIAINNKPSEIPVTPILILEESPATGRKAPDVKERENGETDQERKKTVTLDKQVHLASAPDTTTTFVPGRRITSYLNSERVKTVSNLWSKHKERLQSQEASSLKPSATETSSLAANAKKSKVKVEDLCKFCSEPMFQAKREKVCKKNPLHINLSIHA